MLDDFRVNFMNGTWAISQACDRESAARYAVKCTGNKVKDVEILAHPVPKDAKVCDSYNSGDYKRFGK